VNNSVKAIDRGLQPAAISLADANIASWRRHTKCENSAKDHRSQPLFGIPILLKDNIDTGDGMQTTAGSLALVGSKPARDAFIVRRLRAAGALILGKTNLSEWAHFRSTLASSGWSGRGGQTRNPYAPNRNPCGSSSGSGAAIAADLAVVAGGTETDGSIVCPSSVQGLVGLCFRTGEPRARAASVHNVGSVVNCGLRVMLSNPYL
jgi:amidase